MKQFYGLYSKKNHWSNPLSSRILWKYSASVEEDQQEEDGPGESEKEWQLVPVDN
jgi:hypothetical protein